MNAIVTSSPASANVVERMRAVRALVCDVDGVLTNGKIHYLAEQEIKSFSVADGFAITLARQVGWKVAFLTARGGAAVERRARELGAELISGERSKGKALRVLAERWNLPLTAIAYMGDDWIDLPALTQVGLATTVPNATQAVRERAHWQSVTLGGNGALRELVETVLRVQGHYDTLLERYLMESGE